jgi:hypothetical protein
VGEDGTLKRDVTGSAGGGLILSGHIRSGRNFFDGSCSSKFTTSCFTFTHLSMNCVESIWIK